MRLVWSARCKSGYQFRRDGKWRPCRRMCSRGALLCADCATAEVIEAERRAGFMARLIASVRLVAMRPAEVR